jgi:hypothetical protein
MFYIGNIMVRTAKSAPYLGNVGSKPFSAGLVHDHLRRTLPDGKKPEPLKEKA